MTSLQRLTLVPETSNHLINIARFGDDGGGGGVDDNDGDGGSVDDNNKDGYKDWTALELYNNLVSHQYDQ